MGEGEGARDVSDEIEDEDQMLGAQQAGAEQPEKPDQVPLLTLYLLSLCQCTRHFLRRYFSQLITNYLTIAMASCRFALLYAVSLRSARCVCAATGA